MKNKIKKSNFFSRFNKLGPGVISGAADDDPSGIASYSQAGAQFGLNLLWMSVFLFPILYVFAEMSARIGLVTGKGLISIMKAKYSKKIIYPTVFLLFFANTINISADLGAIGMAANLVFPHIPSFLYIIFFTVFILFSEIFLSYKTYVKFLKILTLSLISYIITALIVGGNWEQILKSSFIPHIEINENFLIMIVAMFGTTISPYVFLWQASEEAEEDVNNKKIKDLGIGKPRISKNEIKIMKKDIVLGIFFSLLIMWSIIVTTAGSIHMQGITDITSAEQAAKALEPSVNSFPNSGLIAKIIFAIGIIGTGLLAIPILAGSSAYAFSDAFGWKEGLSKKFKQAKFFYFTIIISTILGLFLSLIGFDPIKMLIYAAIINAVIVIPILIGIVKIGNDKKLLNKNTNSRFSNAIAIITVVIMSGSVILMTSVIIMIKN